MEENSGEKKVITRMRPDPDFKYLTRRARQMADTGTPLARGLNRNPGEIPGFYTEKHNE